MTCFARVGMEVPATGGDCLCGEFVRFDLVYQRTAHFFVCPVVEERIAEAGIEIPADLDEAAVKVGMSASNSD